MNIKIFRFFLKIWIVLGSLAAFLGGWIMLGHSGKPVTDVQAADPNAASQLAPLPTLAPLPSLSSGSTSSQGLQPLAQQPSSGSSTFRPRLRTRGS
jgi:hypothetical protein